MDVGIRVCRIYTFPPFRMDPVRRTLTRDGERIDLTARLFDTLLYLVENHHRVVSRDELERAIWGGRNVAGANVAVAISALRRCLQTPGSPSDVIKTISGQGYRLDSAVVVEPGLIPMVAADAAAPGAPANVAPRRRARVAAAVCVAALVTASAAAYWAVRAGGGPAQRAFTPPPRSIAVLPFKNASGDPARDYFSDGLSEELIDSLSQVRALHVAARQSAFSFKGTPAREQDIARRLNVAAVLGGSVRQDGGRLVIGVHLTDGTTGRELWANTYDRAAGDVLELQTELARSVTGALKVQLAGTQSAMLTLGGTTDPAALDAYLRAIAASRHHDTTLASLAHTLRLFDQAVALDPNFAMAQAHRALFLWSYAATSGSGDRSFTKGLKDAALAGASKAVALAPDLATAHIAMGYALGAYIPDFARQEVEFSRARALAPGSSAIAAQYARFEMFAGHTDTALAAAEQAVASDPLDPAIYSRLAWILYYARRPADAAGAVSHARQLGLPRTSSEAAFEGSLDLAQHNPEAARRDCENDIVWETNFCLALAYHALGRQQDSLAEIAKLEAHGPDSGPFVLACIYAQLGEPDKALDFLERAYRVRDQGILQLRADPLLDPIRAHPRFKAIDRLLD